MNAMYRFCLMTALCSGVMGVALPITTWAQEAMPAPVPQVAPAASPDAQSAVAERLNIVPVFTIVSADGSPILANVEQEGRTMQVASFWLDKAQADQAVQNVRTSNPDIGGSAQVVPVPLGEAFQVAEQQMSQRDDIIFQVVARDSDLQTALQVARAAGQTDLTQFPGVPLFYGLSEQGYLTLESDGVEVVPFFFAQQDLDRVLQQGAQTDPSITGATRIEVTTLELVVDSMLEDPSSDAGKIIFVPSRESIQFIQSQSPDAFNLE